MFYCSDLPSGIRPERPHATLRRTRACMQVYWYKYDHTGGALAESHRDGRLSDYTRNLIYILRASNPKK